jgi:hypothetical protein
MPKDYPSRLENRGRVFDSAVDHGLGKIWAAPSQFIVPFSLVILMVMSGTVRHVIRRLVECFGDRSLLLHPDVMPPIVI